MGDGKGMGTMGIALLLFGIWGYGLVDVLRRPDYVFRAHSHGKTLWVALQIFLFPLGTFLYLGLVWGSLRPPVSAATSRACPGSLTPRTL